MRYVRQQYFLTTISDQDVTAESDIKALLESLQRSSTDITVEYLDKRADRAVTHNKARIRKAQDGHIDIVAFGNNGSVVVKGISFEDIRMVKMVAKTHNTIIKEEKLSRFDILDIGKEEG